MPPQPQNAGQLRKDNYPADREAVREILRLYPKVRPIALANRAYLKRAVRFLAAEAGIQQFLDIGTGIPSAGNVHEIARQAAPSARVVYVDNDHCKSGCSHADGLYLVVPAYRGRGSGRGRRRPVRGDW